MLTWFKASNWPILALLVSASMLAAAHAFENFMMLAPCPLCLQQREVYWAAIAVSLFGLFLMRFLKTPLSLRLVNSALTVIFLIGTAIAVYHAGVEWAFWEGPSDCAVDSVDLSFDAMTLDEPQKVVSCTEPLWSLFGLSMAAYNALISAVLTILSALFTLKGHQKSL